MTEAKSTTGDLTRQLWQRYETIHDVTYFSPRSSERATALGFKGYWMGYFAYRSAPLGPVAPAVVTATFFGFHASRAQRALPDAWDYATPAQTLVAREDAAREAMSDVVGPYDFREAADLAWQAAQLAETSGRPLGAANQALPRPADAGTALWVATSVLREHRGDGHNAVLVSRAISPVEAHLIKVAAGESDEQWLKTARGFPDDEWEAGRDTLLARGLVDESGGLTLLGVAEHRAVEEATDRAAEQPWRSLGAAESARLLELLRPIAAAVISSGLIPTRNPVGMVLDET